MGMGLATERWTADRVRALPPDRNRYEVIDGELYVTPSPILRHQRALAELHLALAPYVRTHGIGEVVFAPSDVEFDFENMVEPDLFVLGLVDGRKPQTVEEAGMPLLIVEVLSPSTARADRNSKRRLYQRFHVPEYWIIDVDARVVERWRPSDDRPEILTESIEWSASPSHPPFVLRLPEFFESL